MLFGDFMMGARSRLLPMSIPLRFFAAAVLFHVAAWGLLLGYAGDAPGFVGGLGHLLASLHFVTLGVLAMTGMGAAFQLLPVATKRPVRSETACKAAFWLMLAGLLALGHGMGHGDVLPLGLGGVLVVVALALFAFLITDNLRQVKDMRVVTDQAWIAMGGLLFLLALASLLVADYAFGGFLPDHRALALAHGVVAAYGFMGMLALAFSFVLIPMFCLAPPPDVKNGRRAGWMAGAAVLLAAAGLVHDLKPVLILGGLLGLAASALHLWVMAKVMKSRMRKNLGDSFVLIRLAWGLMPLSIVVGLAAALGFAPDRTGPLFGFVLVFGWLLTFLLGILQRILPFLASMHSVRPGVKPALVSALTADRPLRLHMILHIAALAVVSAGLAGQWAPLVRLGAGLGLLGALSYAVSAAHVGFSLRKHLFQQPQSSEK
ncbi:MAG TPA: hypothetical protein VM661_17400 [Candidatus Sulfotelmatobacter sp.]|jgi:hypothetical protein|nr:hypothetical protein [Candidatus Sulfotelmatobacter sp.]